MTRLESTKRLDRNQGKAAAQGGLYVTLIMIGLTLFLGIFLYVLLSRGLIIMSGAYQQGIGRAAANTAVQQSLGDNITPQWWIGGRVQNNGAEGHADLQIPLEGSKGRGTVYAVADRQGVDWQFTRLEFVRDGESQGVDLRK